MARLWKRVVPKFNDRVAGMTASPIFIIAHIAFWAWWIGFKIEDFPYARLVLIVAFEGMLIGAVNLNSQNRQTKEEAKLQQHEIDVAEVNAAGIQANLEAIQKLTGVVEDIQSHITHIEEEENRDNEGK